LLAQRSWRPLLLSIGAGVVALSVLAPATAAQAAPTQNQIEQQIATAQSQLEKVIEQYDKLGEQLAATQKQAAALQQSLPPLQAKVDAASVQVNNIAAAAYMGSLDEFSAVVSAPDTATVVDRLVTISQLGHYEDQQIQTLQQDQAAHNAKLDELNATIADQNAQRKQMAEQRKTIEASLTKLYAMRAQLAPAPLPPSGAGSKPPNVSGKSGLAVNFAYAQLGKPYVYAAAGPDSYDCSGLTMMAWHAAGVALSHNAAEQWNEVAHISRASLAPGDLVFYDGLGHVAIYIGSNQVIHAPTQGDVVRIASVDMMTPYGYGRPG
jgi:cell wall-associated NlpC family hydrolase